MRKAGLVFALTFAAVVAAGIAFLYWPEKPAPPADEKPARRAVPVARDFTPDGFAEFKADYPVPGDGPSSALTHFLVQARERGRMPDAYRAVGPGEAAAAFRELAYQCTSSARGGDPGRSPAAAALRELVAAHEARVGPDGDPLLGGYQAQLLVWEGRYAAAEPLLARALERYAASRDGWGTAAPSLARRLRAEAFAEAGGWRDGAVPPPGVTYEAMFWHLLNTREKANDADRLLDVWAANSPDELGRTRCRMFADYKGTRWGPLLAAADAYLAAAPRGDPYRYDAGLMRVRALARLSRFAEAYAALDVVETRPPIGSLKDDAELLVALLAGDEARADRVLGSGRVRVDWVYGHEEHGPLLRSDRYTALRAKYPPPAPKP